MRLQITLFEIMRSPQSKYSNHTKLSKDYFFFVKRFIHNFYLKSKYYIILHIKKMLNAKIYNILSLLLLIITIFQIKNFSKIESLFKYIIKNRYLENNIIKIYQI